MTKRVFANLLVSMSAVAWLLTGCNKAPDSGTTDSSAAQAAQEAPVKSENDQYIEKLNQEVRLANPDALLDEVNHETSKAAAP